MEKNTTVISVRDFFRILFGGGLMTVGLFLSGAFGGRRPTRPAMTPPTTELRAGMESFRVHLGKSEELIGLFGSIALEVAEVKELNTAGLVRNVNLHTCNRLMTITGRGRIDGLGEQVDTFVMGAFPGPVAKETLVDSGIRSRLVERYNALEWLVQNEA